MTIDLIFPAFPPALDGIGDYTSCLAAELGTGHEVRVLTAQEDATAMPDADVTVERAFSMASRNDAFALVDAVAARGPEWVILQYNPFSWGHWGFAPHLPRLVRELRASSPNTKIALMVHEPFVPIESPQFAVMTTWQRWQLWQMGKQANLIFFSIEPWIDRFSSWFPQTSLLHLPVGSNIPLIPTSRTNVRHELGIKDELVVGIFGSGHPSRLLHFVDGAVRALDAHGHDPLVLYVGADGQKVRAALGRARLLEAGALPAADVSHHFAAMDLYLAPFAEGVSTRRGSFLAGLQHGIPTVTTTGSDTGPLLSKEVGVSFHGTPDSDPLTYATTVCDLADSPVSRETIGTAGQQLFERTFSWPAVGDRLIESLEQFSAATTPSPSRPSVPSLL